MTVSLVDDHGICSDSRHFSISLVLTEGRQAIYSRWPIEALSIAQEITWRNIIPLELI